MYIRLYRLDKSIVSDNLRINSFVSEFEYKDGKGFKEVVTELQRCHDDVAEVTDDLSGILQSVRVWSCIDFNIIDYDNADSVSVKDSFIYTCEIVSYD